MAVCEVCKQEMTEAASCLPSRLRFTPFLRRKGSSERRYDRILCGQERRFGGLPEEPARCSDCNVVGGAYHHPCCDWEECPRCHRQLISCDCHDVGSFVDMVHEFNGRDSKPPVTVFQP
jgi:hypothetical protein